MRKKINVDVEIVSKNKLFCSIKCPQLNFQDDYCKLYNESLDYLTTAKGTTFSRCQQCLEATNEKDS